MTNLQRWLLYAALCAAPYFALIFSGVRGPLFDFLPLIALIAFGLYAAGTVLYRTFTFNDCPEAAKELQKEIQEARKDLIAKGFRFRDKFLTENFIK